MSADPYRVIIVVDGSFGRRLEDLPRDVPVWIVRSDTNEAAALRGRTHRPEANHLIGITTFDALSDSSEQNLLGIFEDIDLHHGIYSSNPPYREIEVFGTNVTSEIKSLLMECGFAEFHSTADGFTAKRRELPKGKEN